jgi:hypothetical protein
MEFYKSLWCNCIYFGIVLTPFEAFVMKYSNRGHGLCLCGLGVMKYRCMGHALFAILQQLLPTGDSFVRSQLEAVGNNSNNGFELLWLLQKHYITMFNLTKEPSWTEWHDDIFRYAKRVLMHCVLSRYRNTTYSKVNCSLLFLCGLQGQYKDIGTSYISIILAYQQEHREAAVLPNHLRILALSQTLVDANNRGMTRDIATSSRASRISTSVPENEMLRDDFTVHTQDFMAMKAELQGNRNGNTHGPRGPPRAPPNAVLSDCRRNAAPRQSCYQGTCDTFGQWGHPANACNKVGAWAFLCRYHRDRTNTAAIDEAERAWIEKNKPFLRDNDKAPKKVFCTYCNRMGLTKNQVNKEMDWDFFSDDKADKE